MEFEADRMTGLQLTDDVVLPERNVILEEQNQRMGNNPRARLGEQIDAALYLNNPYGKPVIGWRHEMEQLSRDDAIGFYRRFYAPNNAIVVIAGDVDPRKVRAMVEETYGKIPRHGNVRRACGRRSRRRWRCARSRLPTRGSKCRLCSVNIWCLPSGQQSAASRKHSRCSRTFSAAARTAAFIAALVVDKQMAVMASAWYDANALDLSKFGVVGRAAPRRYAAAA